MSEFQQASTPLLERIRRCDVCRDHLPLGPRPVLNYTPSARLLIVGQAPGVRVHNTGIPWNDPSGDRLREWLQTDRETFYDPEKVAIVPMGFCYPGTGRSGDLPPRPECAATWMDKILDELINVESILVIGQYAHAYHLPKRERTLTETVRQFERFAPRYFPLPHPSPRNNLWLKKNPWFPEVVLPELRRITAPLLR